MLGASSLENNSIQFKRENSNEILIKFDCQETCLANKMIVSRSTGGNIFPQFLLNYLTRKQQIKEFYVCSHANTIGLKMKMEEKLILVTGEAVIIA